MAGEHEWKTEDVTHLLEMYRDRPNLWNCKADTYKDRNKRHDSLMEIAEYFKVPKEEIERKLKNLLSHFKRELKKEKTTSGTGSGTDNAYKSRWFAYNYLLFLKDRDSPRGMQGTQVREIITANLKHTVYYF